MTQPPRSKFEDLADRHREEGLIPELWDFLCHNKKWWLIPILVVLVVFGALVVLSANPVVTPFIYTLF